MRKTHSLKPWVAAESEQGPGTAHALPEDTSHLVMEHIAHGVAVFDQQFRLLLSNRQYQTLLGYPRKFLKRGIHYEEIRRFDAQRGEGASLHRDRLAPLLNKKRQRDSLVRWEHRRPNGRYLAVRRVTLAQGGFIDTYTDITKRKLAEKAALESARFLRTTLEHMPDGIRVFDRDLKLVAWNRKSLEMFDYPKKLGKVGTPYQDFLAFIANRDRTENHPIEGTEAKIRRATLGVSRDNIVQTTKGRMVQKRRNRLPNGGFVTLYTDITQQCETEEKIRRQAQELSLALESLAKERDRAERASRVKSEFLSSMSHELRTPLNAIIGFSECILHSLHGPLGSTRYHEYAGDIRDSGLHLLDIVNDILDISKVEAGKFELDEANVDIGQLLQSCCRLIRERSASAGVSLTTEISGSLPWFRADERRLKQVIINLLSNAIKFTFPGGSVHIEASNNKKGLRISVKDTGIGMKPEDIEKALLPFTQIHNAQTRTHQGTGLGLPLSAAFMRLHEGGLQIESAPGEGTIVSILLPASRAVMLPVVNQSRCRT